MTLEELRRRPDGRNLVWTRHEEPAGAGWHIAIGMRTLCDRVTLRPADEVLPVSDLFPPSDRCCTECLRRLGIGAELAGRSYGGVRC